jgi:hypothetical protein
MKVVDGVNSENLHATDLHKEFFDIGYDLFRDKCRLHSQFIAADIHSQESPLWQLKDKIDIIWAGNILHLFLWSDQVRAVTHMLKLLNPQSQGMIIGCVVGHKEPGSHILPDGTPVYRHDVNSFKTMFYSACDAVGETWKVEIEAREFNDEMMLKTYTSMPPGTLRIEFVGRKQ